jgi:hypothetical protein
MESEEPGLPARSLDRRVSPWARTWSLIVDGVIIFEVCAAETKTGIRKLACLARGECNLPSALAAHEKPCVRQETVLAGNTARR